MDFENLLVSSSSSPIKIIAPQIDFEAYVSIDLSDQDGDGNPIGVEFTLTANSVSSGDLTFMLRHEPNKSASGVADGDITNAYGSTDYTATFSISVE